MRYARGAVDGTLTVCRKTRMACQRFLDDLKKSQTDPAYPWVFDEHKAARPVTFIEHFLRPTKGDYDRMELMDWQCFIECNLYGWVSKTDGSRRYREALILVGTGNGKSTMMAGNATFLACKDGEPGPDIYLLANSKEQAGIVFSECKAQIEASPSLAARFRTLRDGLYYDKANAKIAHRSSDSGKLDGLNPHGAIFDEIHEYRDFKLLNIINRKTVKRRQPLSIYITTMGYVIDGPLAYYYGVFTDAMNGTLPQATADRMFAYIAELDPEDDVEDSSTWIKANPSLGKLLDLEQLKNDWERCKHIPQERADFICKQLNIFTNSAEAKFVDFEILKRNSGTFDPAGLVGRECYGGFDLSLTEDFTAAALEFPLEDGRCFWLGHTWIPQKKVELDNEKIPYYEWAMQGRLTIVPGDYVRYELLFEWFQKAMELYDIMSIGYDPANAMRLVQSMEAAGMPVNLVRQGPLTLNGPMKNLRELLLDGGLVFNNDPLCRWYLDNVKIKQGGRDAEHENWLPTKAGRYNKIDGFAALLDAHAEQMRLNPVGRAADGDGVTIITL